MIIIDRMQSALFCHSPPGIAQHCWDGGRQARKIRCGSVWSYWATNLQDVHRGTECLSRFQAAYPSTSRQAKSRASYFGAARALPAFGTIARNSNGSCERFSPACRCTPTQSISPARRCVSFALPSGWVSRKCASVSHTTSLALMMSCIGVFSWGTMRTRTTMMDSFSNSTLASAGPAGGGADDVCGVGCAPGPACCAQPDSDANARSMQPMKMLVLAGAYFICDVRYSGP